MAKKKKSNSVKKQPESQAVRQYSKVIKEAKQMLSTMKEIREPEVEITKQEKRIEKLTREKKRRKESERVTGRIKSVAEKAITGELKAFKKPFLTKPKAKGPRPISARKTLKSFAQHSGPLVREVEPKELVKDERSLYFKKEFTREKMETNKWLS